MALTSLHSGRCGLLTTVCITTVYRRSFVTPQISYVRNRYLQGIYIPVSCAPWLRNETASPQAKCFRSKRANIYESVWTGTGLLNRRKEVGPLVQIRLVAILCPCIGGNNPGTTCSVNIDPPTAMAYSIVLSGVIPNIPHIESWKQALSFRENHDRLLSHLFRSGGSRLHSENSAESPAWQRAIEAKKDSNNRPPRVS